MTEGSKDLPRGTYRYLATGHLLSRIGDHGVAGCFRDVALQNWVKSAPALVAVTAVPARTSARYGDRAHRYVLSEAGACAHSLALMATALGLSSGTAGAFDDGAVQRALDLPAEGQALLLVPVGQPRD